MELHAGAKEVVITPPVGVPLLGTIQRSTGVHDDLYARALVLQSGAEHVAIVCLDLIALDFTLVDDLRAQIHRRTGIQSVLLNCSHTHSSPFTVRWSCLGWRTFCAESVQWRADLVEKVTGAVAGAASSTAPASLAVGRAPVKIGINRRFPSPSGIIMKPYPQGIVVPWVDVLRVDGVKGPPIAILFSHAAHPVIIHGASREISADYPGYAAKALRASFSPQTVPMFAQAFGANINGDPLRGGFEAAERAGNALAKAAVEAAGNARTLRAKELAFRTLRSELPIRDYPPLAKCQDALREAEARLLKSAGPRLLSDSELWDLQDRLPPARPSDPSNPSDDVQPMAEQPWWHADTVLCLKDLVEKATRGEKQFLRFEVSALTAGEEWCLLTTPHELFAEYQHWIEQSAPFDSKMALAYTNGLESYVPTDRDFALGGYEAAAFPDDAAALRFPYRLPLRPGVEGQVKNLLSTIWKKT